MTSVTRMCTMETNAKMFHCFHNVVLSSAGTMSSAEYKMHLSSLPIRIRVRQASRPAPRSVERMRPASIARGTILPRLLPSCTSPPSCLRGACDGYQMANSLSFFSCCPRPFPSSCWLAAIYQSGPIWIPDVTDTLVETGVRRGIESIRNKE